MSSRGGEKEEEDEDFYDCEDTMESPDRRSKEAQKEDEQEKVTRQEGGSSECCHDKTETSTDRGAGEGGGLQEEAQQSDRLQEEAQQSDRLQEVAQESDKLQEEAQESDKLQEEAQESDKLQEEAQQESDSDSEIKDIKTVEFDDDYLREEQKDMTEEEKESRRQQSLTLKETGNGQFKAGAWLDAERSYTEALGVCPVCFSKERAVLFSNRAAARLHRDLKDQAIADCTRAIELNPEYLRALLRRAELYEQTEKLDEALEDYKKVLERDPNHTGARQACMRLPQQIQERNEKLKEEMMSKLKDLGNMILRPFGLSTNNFQVNQDQSTGSYSINFVQNPNNNNR